MKALLPAVLLLLGFATDAAATEARFKPTPDDADGYTETFTISADLAGGGVAVVQLGATNAGPGSGRGVCRVMAAAGSLTWRYQKVVADGEWSYAPEPDPHLAIGGCAITDGRRPVLTAVLPEGRLEIRIQADPQWLQPPSIPGPHPYDLPGFASGITATITLRPASGAPVSQGATVHIEHARSLATPGEIGRQWFRLRTTGAGGRRFALVRRDGESDAGTGWVYSGGQFRPVRGVRIEAGEQVGRTPVTLRLEGRTLRLAPAQGGLTYAPLRELGLLGRVLGAVVGDPLLAATPVTWTEEGFAADAVLETMTFR